MRRVLITVAVLGAALLGLSACDGSAPALTVNGQELSVSGFNHQLAQWVSDKALVASIDQSAAQQASGAGSQPVTVAGAGGPGTYSQNFVGLVLNVNIEVMALRSYLSSHGQAPTPDQLVTARAIEDESAQYWDSLAEPLRELLLDRLADEGVLSQAPSDLTTVQQAYGQVKPWLFSELCMDESVTPDLDGANKVVASGHVLGAQVCYNQQSLEAQPQAFQSAAIGLSTVGQISKPVRTSYGYQVLELTERTTPPLNNDVAQVLAAASNPPQQLTAVITGAKVKVNPAYGSWDGPQGCLIPPGATAQEACGQGQ